MRSRTTAISWAAPGASGGKEQEQRRPADHRAATNGKVRIEVGYGLEPVLTDALSALIIQNEILPAFRTGGLRARNHARDVTPSIAQLTLDPAEAQARAAVAANARKGRRPHRADHPRRPGLPVHAGRHDPRLPRRRSQATQRRASPLIWERARSHAQSGGAEAGGGFGGGFGGGGGFSAAAAAVSAAGGFRRMVKPFTLRRPRPRRCGHRGGREADLGRNLLRLARRVSSYRDVSLGWAAAAALLLPWADPVRLRARLVARPGDSWEAAHMAARNVAIGQDAAAYAVIQAAVFLAVY
jgi:hypothetical protein